MPDAFIALEFDPEANVWYIADSSFPGLSGAAPTVEALEKRIPVLLADLTEANAECGFDGFKAVDYAEITTHKRLAIREPA